MTPAQVKAARLLLGWPRKRLAAMSNVPYAAIADFERGAVARSMTIGRLDAIRMALKTAGIVFTNGEEPGVKLRRREA